MYKYIAKRLLMMIPVLLGITVLVFLMLHLTPGDPARSMLGDTASPEEIARKFFVSEDAVYMPDFVTDTDGKLREVRYDKVKYR